MAQLIEWLKQKLQERFGAAHPLPWKIIDAHEKLRDVENDDHHPISDETTSAHERRSNDDVTRP